MKKLSPRAKNIAICVTALSHAGGQVLSGMMRYVSEFPGWNIRLMTFPQVATPDLLRKFESEQVDGLIISYCPSSDFHKAIRELTIPVVAIDRDDLVGRRLSHIRTGQRQIGVTAARHFLSLGRFASFGFVPFHDSAIWSIERQAGYCAELSCQHRDVAICPNPATTINRHDLATWLKDLKKPAAVMAANDALAAEVLSVAHAAGLHVPKDLAVIGVDNDPTYCTISSPRLTSVDPNFHQLG